MRALGADEYVGDDEEAQRIAAAMGEADTAQPVPVTEGLPTPAFHPLAPPQAQHASATDGLPVKVPVAKQPDKGWTEAQREASERRLSVGLLRAGAMASEALTGAKVDKDAYNALDAQADDPVKQYVLRKQQAAEEEKRAKQARLSDPTSPESIRFRTIVKNTLPDVYSDDELAHLTAADEGDILKYGTLRETIRARKDATASAQEDRRMSREMAEQRHADDLAWRKQQAEDMLSFRERENALNRTSREKNAAVIAHDKDEQQRLQREGEMRKEVMGHPVIKAYQDAAVSYDKMQRAAKDPSAAGDLALIFSYMKTLDPGSTVREGEFANAQNAAGIPERIRNAWNKGISGERLSPEQRAEFLRNARDSFDAQRQRAEALMSGYSKVAKDSGVEPERVVVPGTTPDIDLSKPPPQRAQPPPPNPDNIPWLDVKTIPAGKRARDVIPEGESRRINMGGGKVRVVKKVNGSLVVQE